jgi:copper chaperone CopZ
LLIPGRAGLRLDLVAVFHQEVCMSDTKTEFYVTGMTCNGCIKKATEALTQIQGYESASFDLEQGTGVVVGDIDPQAAAQALTEAGYPAVVKSA